MDKFLFLCLLPLGALGALLGGYKPLDVGDPVLHNKIMPMLKPNQMLGRLPVLKVEQQRLFGVTNYKVYQGIPNKSGVHTCVKISCRDNGKCDQPQPCRPSRTSPIPEEAIRRSEAPLKAHTVHRLGGQEAGSVQDVQGAAAFVVEKMNSMSNSMFRMVSEEVTNVTKQVVAGTMYRFTISLVSSACRNSPDNQGKQLDQCPMGNQAQVQQCRVAVWHKLNGEYQLESHQCGQMQAHPLLGQDGHDLCHQYISAFKQFKQDFNKLYEDQREEADRFQTFCNNMKTINLVSSRDESSGVYGVSKFADLTEAEFRKLYLTPVWDLKASRPWMTSAPKVDLQGQTVPKRFDWREHGAVTPVKNQGSCGSCWAFSTTGNIEGQWAINKKKLVSLSEQELVDCDKFDEGCNGGLPSNAYRAIMDLGGLETEQEYKYMAENEKCHFNRSDVVARLTGAVNISSNETEMKAWLYKNGPISIGINAFAMQFYMGGVAHPWKIFCNPSSIDHGVLIVGYDETSDGEPYWIIKNSWGADWGEKGYYLVYRGAGVCGLNTMCTSAVV